jgi:hypothetical protein
MYEALGQALPGKAFDSGLYGGFAPHESVRPVCSKPTPAKSVREDEQEGQNLHNCVSM